MEKKLVAVGNGLALFIDRPLQRLLGLDATTLVAVSTDGVRLTIEPCGVNTPKKKAPVEPWDAPRFLKLSLAASSEERRIEYGAPAVFEDLMARGLTDDHMLQLHHRYWPVDVYCQFRAAPRPLRLDANDRDDDRRLEQCLCILRDGGEWGPAITRALELVPMREIAPWFGYRIRGGC
jgi:hypothetical protein